jgi:hypothetical protein
MNFFIFGFQRRVWCPKWTPASSISRMVIGAAVAAIASMCLLFGRRPHGRDDTGFSTSAPIA